MFHPPSKSYEFSTSDILHHPKVESWTEDYEDEGKGTAEEKVAHIEKEDSEDFEDHVGEDDLGLGG